MGYDIYVGKKMSINDISKTICELLNLKSKDLYIIEGRLADYFYQDENGNWDCDYKKNDPRELVEIKYKRSGEFPFLLEIHLSEEDTPIPELDFAKSFSRYVGTRTIIGSTEINPYHWILVEPDGSHRNVFVDRETLDKENAFVVVGDADY